MKPILITLLCVTTFCFSCKSQNNDRKKQSIELEKRAVMTEGRNHNNDDSLKVALDYVNQAIDLNDTNYLFYGEKAHILCALGKNDEAISTLNKGINLHPEYLTTRTMKAMLLDKMGKREEADNIYQVVLKDYQNLETKYPDSVNINVNKIFILQLLNRKHEAIDDYDVLLIKHPDNKKLKQLYDINHDLDRDKFIQSICN